MADRLKWRTVKLIELARLTYLTKKQRKALAPTVKRQIKAHKRKCARLEVARGGG